MLSAIFLIENTLNKSLVSTAGKSKTLYNLTFLFWCVNDRLCSIFYGVLSNISLLFLYIETFPTPTIFCIEIVSANDYFLIAISKLGTKNTLPKNMSYATNNIHGPKKVCYIAE